VRRWDRLTERQVDLLRRIAAGDDLSSAEGAPYRISARALQGRRLVDVSRRRGVWRATITDAGRFYLEHGFHADDPAHILTPTSGDSRARVPAPPALSVRDPKSASVLLLAQDLVENLVGGDGLVRIEEPDEPTRSRYRRAIHAAKQHKLIPEGHQLRHTGRNSGDIVIRLYDNATVDDTEWNRIRLTTRHHISVVDDVVAALQKDPSGLDVSPDLLPRALELVRLLGTAARARGHRLVVNTKGSRPTLSLRLEKSRRAVRIGEPYDEVPHVPTDEERRRQKRNPWLLLPEHDRVRSGRLVLEVNRTGHGKTSRWEDDKRLLLESRVGKIITEVEAGFLADQREHEEWLRARREEEERWARQKAEERAQWEQAVATATLQAQEKLRADRFRAAFDGWTAAEAIRAFCTELEVTRGTEEAADQNLGRWIAWARQTADRLDPITNGAVIAKVDFDVEPKPHDLEPFMGGWSVTGPQRAYRTEETRRQYADVRAFTKEWHHGMRGNPQAWRWRS